MDHQLIAVIATIAAAGAYLAYSSWRTWFGKKSPGCGSGCGNCAKPTATPEVNAHRIALPVIAAQ